MKKKIFDALKNKFKNLGFSDKAFDGVASFLEKTITEDDQIETGISGVEDLLKAFQGDTDSRVQAAIKKATEEAGKPKPKEDAKPDEPKPVPASDDTPAWAKSLLESHKELTDKVSALEAGKTTDSRKSRLDEVLKGFSETYRKTVAKAFARAQFDSEEDFAAYLEEIKTDGAEFVQSEANEGLKGMGKPAAGSGAGKGEATKEEIAAVMKNIM